MKHFRSIQNWVAHDLAIYYQQHPEENTEFGVVKNNTLFTHENTKLNSLLEFDVRNYGNNKDNFKSKYV